jgi:Holliday junction resolvase
LNNKRLGTAFEREFCDYLFEQGYWVHFITPAPNGAQPFDVIAVKGGRAYAFDCKTSAKANFSIKRLEQNQIMAFERWLKCGNTEPRIAVKYKNNIYLIPYRELKKEESINLDEKNHV